MCKDHHALYISFTFFKVCIKTCKLHKHKHKAQKSASKMNRSTFTALDHSLIRRTVGSPSPRNKQKDLHFSLVRISHTCLAPAGSEGGTDSLCRWDIHCCWSDYQKTGVALLAYPEAQQPSYPPGWWRYPWTDLKSKNHKVI